MDDNFQIDENGGEWTMDEGMGPNLNFDNEPEENPLNYETPDNILTLEQLYPSKKRKSDNEKAQQFFNF